MFRSLPHKTKQFFYLLIKLSIVVGAFYFIYQKLTNNSALDFDTFVNFLVDKQVFSIQNIVILLGLTLMNWYLEILKWQQLASVLQPTTIKKAAHQSLAALTASLLTPNRIGEYGFKALYFEKGQRKKALFLNLLGNLGQLFATLVFGLIGMLLLNQYYDISDSYNNLVRMAIIIIAVVGLIGFGVVKTRFQFKGFSSENVKKFFRQIPQGLHVKNLGLSVGRYLVFSFQFYLLLVFFEIDITYLQAMMIITTMYLLASIIPSIFIFDVLVKGSIALFLFNLIGIEDITILCIVTVMWILNFVIPGIIGSIFVMKFDTGQLQL